MTQRQTQAYAGRLERFLAYLIDAIILLVPSMLLVGLMGAVSSVTLASFLINLVYYTYFTASHWQATPGKRLLGIYVARADRQPLSQRDALERFLAFILPTLPLYTSLLAENTAPMIVVWLSVVWFSPILFTVERMGLHDRLCNTRVMMGKV